MVAAMLIGIPLLGLLAGALLTWRTRRRRADRIWAHDHPAWQYGGVPDRSQR